MAASSGVSRAVPEWPSRRPQWLENLKGVYDSGPNEFYRHIDTWFEQVETSVSISRADDYSRWIGLNYNEFRCFTGIFHAFPYASLAEAIKGSQSRTELDGENIVTAGQVVKLVPTNDFPNDWRDVPNETMDGRMSSVEEHASSLLMLIEKASYSQHG
ncbi:hypothetical protein NW759_001580 [Fusarium solani]|nr:hypothetical protein NW759_001580 [Fusarium solani]